MAQTSYERQPYCQQALQMPETLSPLANIDKMSGVQKPKQSRLELMRQNYEKKRQKDVEDRLAEMRSQQARADTEKVKSGGTVRAFFAERRALEANMKDPYALPPIDRHFRKVKDSSSSAPPRQTRAVQSYTPPAQHKSKSAGRRKQAPQYYRKKSKGVDKQNPLPPLQRGQTSSHKPPTPNKRYETHHTLTTDDSQEDNNETLYQETVHVPKPPQQPNPLRNQRPGIESRSDFDESCSNHSDEPPPNLAKLKAIRQKRLSKQMSLVKQESIEKPTEFQKWQMEQDKQRAERLEKHKQKTSKPQNKTESTLSTRERELLEKIKAEQDKLKEIKRLQQELEEQDRMENEDSSSYELMLADKDDKYYQKQDSFNKERTSEKVQKQGKYVQPKSETKRENKTQVHIQQKKDIVTQMTISNTLPADDDTMEEDEPKEDFTAFYEQAAQNDEAVSLDLTPCTICGRKFATERLGRHAKICNKNSKTKRKAFDVQKQRVSGMEHAKYVLTGDYKKEPPKPKKADWRVQHENFIKTIRYAKGASNEPPPVIENPHYVACPYCERKFNPETAERHIPRCKDIKSRPAPPKANKNRRKR
ncbi:zinc finger C2HC domain-containing protein 1C [Exaiptasia diaphana]|uniref:C2HC/C3H-type domain-containing protein n=1 Tax=Exaiptasia diaphana TaxID=2652724 RepID=A0A913XT44_EXADI|nr:zinc finger C2HC domain-containing protein 1C [Exaiptasia diaphana]KXJ24798.1 Zinc finger C2HC domain-containing protein 1C [Exaiptasia diaphana]